jgi:hypothetical protein
MQKSSFKLYFATILFTLTLASFTFAGEVQCPIAPPPPPPTGIGNGESVPVIINTNPSVRGSYQFLKRFWDLFTQNTDLF